MVKLNFRLLSLKISSKLFKTLLFKISTSRNYQLYLLFYYWIISLLSLTLPIRLEESNIKSNSIKPSRARLEYRTKSTIAINRLCRTIHDDVGPKSTYTQESRGFPFCSRRVSLRICSRWVSIYLFWNMNLWWKIVILDNCLHNRVFTWLY